MPVLFAVLVAALPTPAHLPEGDKGFSGVIEVKLSDGLDFSVSGKTVRGVSGRTIIDFDAVAGLSFSRDRMKVRTLLDTDPKRLRLHRSLLEARSGKKLEDLASYVQISVPTRRLRDVRAMIAALNAMPGVAAAYPMPIQKKPLSPNLVPDQDYLRAAPGGVNADATLLNAITRGGGVRIGDVEHGWNFSHEDLPSCTNVNYVAEPTEVDHGTAVLGELFGKKNAFGVTGIAPDAACYVADWLNNFGNFSTAYAMNKLAAVMDPGDVILLEVQVHGPKTEDDDESCFGCLPAEWSASTKAMIQTVIADGIIVVAAAGNGSQNLDAPEYGGYFARATSSGAIMVGAGQSSASANPRKRLGFSNYGERLDLQGYGEKVTTAGYGWIGSGNTAYTHGFNGTSSASPIVAGSVAVINGYLMANGDPPLDAEQMGALLKSTGTAQAGTEKIGPLPNLTSAIAALGNCGDGVKLGNEACDDGNNVSGDGCSEDCSSKEVCGNGILDLHEQCDDGNVVSGDGCRADCSGEESCGDAHVDPREICDDGNTTAGDGCSEDCKRREICGDRHIDQGELCDDGNTRADDGCSADCKSDERCGNAITDAGEQCDDGDLDDDDGCTSVCTLSSVVLPASNDPVATSRFPDSERGTRPQSAAPQQEQAPPFPRQGCSATGSPLSLLVLVFIACRRRIRFS